jgi:polyether ionophore transport system permease protein
VRRSRSPEARSASTSSSFVFAISLFACAQIAAARHEEAEQRLETLFASPVSRRRWFLGRLLLAVVGSVALAVTVSVLAWAGAASQHAGVSLARMLEAGGNCLPVALFFLGVAALAFASLPRVSIGLSYGLVSVAFVWQLVGSLLAVPHWIVDLTPFRHVGLVPAEPFRVAAALVLLALAAVGMGAATWLFERRDLMGA